MINPHARRVLKPVVDESPVEDVPVEEAVKPSSVNKKNPETHKGDGKNKDTGSRDSVNEERGK